MHRWLTIVPLAVVFLLFQSCLWVPGYRDVSRVGDTGSDQPGSDTRRRTFVEASIGDAKILNPILNADTASSRIVDLTFDGLLTLDENLTIQPQMAESFSVSEWVHVAVPVGGLDDRLQAIRELAISDPALREVVTDITAIPATTQVLSLTREDGEPISIEVNVAKRIRISLSSVSPDIDESLQAANVVSLSDYASWTVATDVADKKDEIEELVSGEIPPIEHNPIILFKLRDDIQFHDGHEFDANDVLFTYESIMNPANLSPRTSDFEPIKSVDVLNERSVRIVYKRLFSPAVIAWTMPILPEHLLNDEHVKQEKEKAGVGDKPFGMRDLAFNRKPVGTGPYRFELWNSDDVIRLGTNDNYYMDPPELKNYAYRVLPDTLVQELELSAGAIDIYTPPPYQAARFLQNERFNTVTMPSNGYSYIAYNLRRPIFEDVRVRTALSMAINIDEIVRYVLFGAGVRATGPYPIITPWHDPTIDPVPYDPDGAIALLGAAGWQLNADGIMEKDGKILSFNLITNQGNPTREAIMSIAQDAWRRIGVSATTQVFEWAVFLEDFVNNGEFDALVLGWSMGAEPDLYQLWHSSQTGYGQLNFTGYKNDEVDQIIESIRSEYDHEEQERLAHELHASLARDQPYTFLFSPRATRVLNKGLKIRDSDDNLTDIEAVPSGKIYQHFDRWTRASLSPDN